MAVLEGFHALKHALRFGADLREGATADLAGILTLAAALAPDIAPRLPGLLEEVDREEFTRLTPAPPPTPVVALARRPQEGAEAALLRPGTLLLLDHPNHLGNVGAAVRVAAAAGAAAVLTTGDRDPWHPAALRGSAGLHFALPVARLAGPLPAGRPLVAIDPAGDPLWEADLPPQAILAFGGERHGLGADLLAAADFRVGIPMQPGVSSLNLATAVAVTLFEIRRRARS
jgi:RNA methyltransferase, TrmH family